jgi:hypothetical protein
MGRGFRDQDSRIRNIALGIWEQVYRKRDKGFGIWD